MSDSKTETNDLEEEDKDEKETEESEDETSIIDENDNNELVALTARFDKISNESFTILHTLKSKMNDITKIHQQFNETTTTFNNISSECKLLLDAMNGIKSEMIHKSLINETNRQQQKYSKTYLKTLSKTELIDIIILLQQNYSDKMKITKTSHPHEKVITNIKAKERMATDYDKIEKQRVVIKALQKKDKQENQLKNRNAYHKQTEKIFVNPHEKVIKNIKATERKGTDYEKIERQRTIIKALKEKKRQQKLQGDNTLKQRNAHRSNNLFADPHEKIPKLKEIKHGKKNKKNKDEASNKEKVMDPVSKKTIEQRERIGQEMQQNDDEDGDGLILQNENSGLGQVDENTPFDNDMENDQLFLESELLKLNMKMLKKRCREYRVSAQGGKLDMISKILQQEQILRAQSIDVELDSQEEFMEEMAASGQ